MREVFRAIMGTSLLLVSKFSAELGHVATESTVRNMKKAYLSLLKKEKDKKEVIQRGFERSGIMEYVSHN